MTVINFPTRPTAQTTAPVVMRLGPSFPGWAMDCHAAEDGQAWVELEHRATGGLLGAHWARGEWAVLDKDFLEVSRATSLPDALRRALV